MIASVASNVRADALVLCGSSGTSVCSVPPGSNCAPFQPVHSCAVTGPSATSFTNDSLAERGDESGLFHEGDLCPSSSAKACKDQEIGATCERQDGNHGICRLTPLTAGGFCLCYPNRIDFRGESNSSTAENQFKTAGVDPCTLCAKYGWKPACEMCWGA